MKIVYLLKQNNQLFMIKDIIVTPVAKTYISVNGYIIVFSEVVKEIYKMSLISFKSILISGKKTIQAKSE